MQLVPTADVDVQAAWVLLLTQRFMETREVEGGGTNGDGRGRTFRRGAAHTAMGGGWGESESGGRFVAQKDTGTVFSLPTHPRMQAVCSSAQLCTSQMHVSILTHAHTSGFHTHTRTLIQAGTHTQSRTHTKAFTLGYHCPISTNTHGGSREHFQI